MSISFADLCPLLICTLMHSFVITLYTENRGLNIKGVIVSLGMNK